MSRGARNAPKPDAVSEIENVVPGLELCVGDEKYIKFGERATVNRALAVTLHDRKQIKVIR